jgi:hypothetical protein
MQAARGRTVVTHGETIKSQNGKEFYNKACNIGLQVVCDGMIMENSNGTQVEVQVCYGGTIRTHSGAVVKKRYIPPGSTATFDDEGGTVLCTVNDYYVPPWS